MVGFCCLETALTNTGTKLKIRWPVVDEIVEVTAMVVDLPFISLNRS
jgi:hypothetical protein